MEAERMRRIVFGILEFLHEEFNSPSTTPESKESLEVGLQCLETAFGISSQDTRYKSAKTLRELYADNEPTPATGGRGADGAGEGMFAVDLGPVYEMPPEASNLAKAEAEDWKNKGNDAMRNMNYSEALGHYNKSVELDGRNSVYFCNRAAAFIKLESYDEALRDCQIAIRLQPNYARAYGRMGVTFSNRNQHLDAIVCYKKALLLEPSNESYSTNLRYSQSALAQEAAQGAEMGGAGGAGLENLMTNPNLISMASQMLRDPNMNQMIQNLMGGLTGGAAPPPQQQDPGAGNAGPAPSQPNPLDNLMQMGQAIANSIRANNPELADQLGVGRNAGFNFGPGGPSGGGSNNPGNDDNVPES